MSKLLNKVFPGRMAGGTPNTVSGLSWYDPVFMGLDESKSTVRYTLMYRNMLIGGQPGSGKSGLMNNVIGHASQCSDVDIVLIDGKLVELSLWKEIANVFIGQNIAGAINALEAVEDHMSNVYSWLEERRRRKITAADPIRPVLVAIDELMMFMSILGPEPQQQRFYELVLSLVALGRAAGISVVMATQRPSAVIVPTALRDIVAYRAAFRCTTEASSDIILGTGWAEQGWDASKIDTASEGVGYLVTETSQPFGICAAYLEDDEIETLAARGMSIRGSLLSGNAA